MAAYTTIDNPELYFQVTTFVGDEVDDRAITLPGSEDMAPNMVWAAEYAGDYDGGKIWDTVRGATKHLFPGRTNTEATNANGLKSFTSDGFTVGTDAATNDDGVSNVAWCWKMGTTSGIGGSPSITPSGYSFSATAKQSIIAYTGTAATATLPHGLSVTPGMLITKSLAGSFQWAVYHHKNTAAPETDYLYLNTTAATVDDVNLWNDTAPTSSLFTVHTSNRTNASANYIAYCFASVQGYSKFGTYEGNGNADGTFVHTGFRPAFIMTKSIDSTSDWDMFDNKRAGYNPDNNQLWANRDAVEATTDMIDILSNGFKCRIATDPNVAETYIYIAFAEAPFVNSNGVPCNAR